MPAKSGCKSRTLCNPGRRHSASSTRISSGPKNRSRSRALLLLKFIGPHLERKLESELELALLVAAVRGELIGARGQRSKRHAQRVRRHRIIDTRRLHGVEQVLDLA